MDGKPDFEVQVDASGTVAAAKIIIGAACAFDTKEFHLVYQMRMLEEDQTLEECGLDGSQPLSVVASRGTVRRVMLKRVGRALLLAAFALFLLHMVLGTIGVGGKYGDDGSGGIIGIVFIGCTALGCGSYAILGVLTSKICTYSGCHDKPAPSLDIITR